MALTEQQKKFVQNYLKTGNATQSYIDAGYKSKGKSAEANSCRLLSNKNVQAYVRKLSQRAEEKAIADMQEIKELWTRFARDEAEDKRTRLKATEYLAKTNGAFLDRVEAKVSTNKLEDFFEK